jgi:hypothetical protein
MVGRGKGVYGEKSEKWEGYEELIAEMLAYDTPDEKTDIEEELASRRCVQNTPFVLHDFYNAARRCKMRICTVYIFSTCCPSKLPSISYTVLPV